MSAGFYTCEVIFTDMTLDPIITMLNKNFSCHHHRLYPYPRHLLRQAREYNDKYRNSPAFSEVNLTLFAIIIAALFMLSAKTRAIAQECTPPYETITRLYSPSYGSYTVWDSVYGEGERREVFKSILEEDNATVTVAGEMRPLAGMDPVIMLVNFNSRGRVVWEKYHAVSAVTNVVKLIRSGNNYVLLVNRHHRGERKNVWLGFFDNKGRFKSQRVIRDPKFDIIANDIITSADGKKFILSLTTQKNIGSAKEPKIITSARINILDSKGKLLVKRTYVVGSNAEILKLSDGIYGDDEQEGIIATGYLENELGKKVGWVMRLNSDASLIWQQQYSRGRSARINLSSPYQHDYILTYGDVSPADSGNIGTWLMLLDADNGKVKWQRYYNGDYDYFASGLVINRDNLITIMMQGKVPQKDKGRGADYGNDYNKLGSDEKISSPMIERDGTIIGKMDYVHVLVLSPRGITLSGESYFNGLGAHGFQIKLDKGGNFMIAGDTYVPYQEILDKYTGMNEPSDNDNNADAADHKSGQKPSGIALLNKRVVASIYKEPKGNQDSRQPELPRTTRDGWVLVGKGPDPYRDPCIKHVAELP